MEIFIHNEIWHVYFVPPYCEILYVPEKGEYTHGTTDPLTRCIYISDAIDGEFLKEVTQHEISHAQSISSNYPIDFETDEIVAQFCGNYCDEVTEISDFVLRNR